MADPILVVVCGFVTLAGVPGFLLYAGGRWRANVSTVVALVLLWAVITTVCVVTEVLIAGFAVLIAACGIVLGTGVAVALSERITPIRLRMALAAGFSVLIFLPLSLIVFGGNGTWLYDVVGALDFGGAIPFTIGGGAFALVLALLSGNRASAERQLALRGAMLLAVAIVGAVVGFELRIDDLTPAIALNAVMTPAVALLAAAGIERVMKGVNTREGLAAGVLAGAAASVAACAYLETVSALLLGLLVGSVAEVAFRGVSAAWRLATPLLIGGMTGLLFLGIFAIGPGFVYSGQPMLFLRQAMVCGVALVYSGAVSVALLLPLRRVLRRAGAGR